MVDLVFYCMINLIVILKNVLLGWILLYSCEYPFVIGYEKRVNFTQNVIFWLFSNSPFQGLNSLRLSTWFIRSIGLLLHRSNIRSYSKPPVPSGEPPKCGIKWRFSNAIDTHTSSAHTGSGRGSEFLVSIAGWWKNNHTRFKVHSCYGFRDISVLKRKFG